MYQKLDPAFKAEWLNALRSGAYNQTKGCMRNSEGYCCLGVAYDTMHCEWQPPTSMHAEDRNLEYITIDNDGLFGTISKSNCKKVMLDPTAQTKLAEMNDEGSTFAKIADWIETNL